MKVTIRGNNPVTSEQVKTVIDELNENYSEMGLKVKKMTIYVRFQDETGRTVEPQSNGMDIEHTFTFKDVVTKKDK